MRNMYLCGGQCGEYLRRKRRNMRKNCGILKNLQLDIAFDALMCYNIENILCPRRTGIYSCRVDESAKGYKMFQFRYFSGESHRDIR